MLIHPELARYVCELSFETQRQIGLLIDRNGHIEYVIAGDSQGVTIPKIPDSRTGMGRLSGLRLVHTHLKGESLSREDLTDLALLRLDLISAIEVKPGGFPGRVYSAYLLPDNNRGQNWEIIENRNPHEIDLNVQELLRSLEDEFARSIAAKTVHERGENAVIVGVFPSNTHRPEISEWMEEFREMVRSSGLNIMDEMVQIRPFLDPRSLLGKGKLQELAIRGMQVGADVIVFGRDLTPGQLRNISESIDIKVIDRTQLILDIFAQHAHTREGKIQVELAQMKYLLPRLVGKYPALSRLRGGIGLRGPGETKLEIDRRRVRDRITRLEREIRSLSQERGQRRAWRGKKGLPVLSIVGYTNTGKSTLFNALTKSDVPVEDKPFATLDPSSRRLRFPKERDVILTDTVGFVRDLPSDLLKAFRSTLEELEQADLLLHVVDLSSAHYREQMTSVDGILHEMGLDRVPRILVFNKMDRLERSEAFRVAERYGGVVVSALHREGLDRLMDRIGKTLFSDPW